MKLKKIIDAVADVAAMPDPKRTTLSRALARSAAFLAFASLLMAVCDWIESPAIVGWIGGYIWGSLTVYGTVRPYLPEDCAERARS